MLENKNLLIAIVLSIAILLGFQLIYGVPTVDNKQSQNSKLESQNLQSLSENNLDPKITNKLKTKGNNVSDSETYVKREKIISETDRVIIKSEKLIGSIQLEGALFDDLTLIKYGENIEKTVIELYSYHLKIHLTLIMQALDGFSKIRKTALKIIAVRNVKSLTI